MGHSFPLIQNIKDYLRILCYNLIAISYSNVRQKLTKQFALQLSQKVLYANFYFLFLCVRQK